ncbi:aldo/keto reductase [Lentzea sp. NPDC059081]|uniref:aldo/keto reductase n=1 Tax=Lentzea sp. NPDC059081 TaxID=3346719 RepID=UPI0036C3B98F
MVGVATGDEGNAAEQPRACLGAGGNLLGIADVHGEGGGCEEIIGALLRGRVSRSNVAISAEAGSRRGRRAAGLADGYFRWYAKPVFDQNPEAWEVMRAVHDSADELDLSPVVVSLSWTVNRPGVTSALVGARSADQLRGCLAAAEQVLPAEIDARLTGVSAPHLGYPEVMYPV